MGYTANNSNCWSAGTVADPEKKWRQKMISENLESH